ncbi:MAG: hypothetical protein FD146_219 [Anaerolineaceae bacterium]|nr:MAG: hypothetical protein FD146_219 [Anaerolineaceae bacterium]
MTKTRSVSIASLLAVLSILAAGCGTSSPAGLNDAQVLSVTGHLLTAINTGNYSAFTRDFSAEMFAAFPEDQFLQLRGLLYTASGNYVSCGEMSLSNQDDFAVYRIRCAYELEDVVVTIVFRIGGTQVEGLFFDSPNLRAASK